MNQLGKYQLVAEIARGGMGIVYLAVTQGPARFSKLLVIKELKPEFVEDDNFLAMFLEEARLTARLSHPNIVQTYEVGEDDKRHYLVMDYLDGVTLARVLRKKSPLFTRNMQLRVICEILAGLHYAHTLQDFDGTPLGIVHRDVTPQNVFITFDGTAKIVDFGIAKALDSSIETRTGVLKGKPAYMAPEQIAGEVDPRSDVFSAGVMIWEAVAGQRMWAKKGDVEVLASMLKGAVPSIREMVPDVPDDLARIIERALMKDRDARQPSAAALQEELERFLRSDPRATMRDVAKVVTDIFAEERTNTRTTIDAHLARLKAGSVPADKLPSLVPPPMDTRSPTGHPLSERSLVSGGTPAGSAFSMGAAPLISTPPEEGARGKRSRAPFIVGGVALLLTGLGFVVGLGARWKSTPPPASGVLAPSASPTGPDGLNPPASSAVLSPTVEPAPPSPPPQETTEKAPGRTEATPSTKPVPTPPPRTARWWTPPPKPAGNAGANATRPQAPAPQTTERAPDPDDAKSRVGYLTLDTYPWTRVSVAGRVLGDTPLVHVPLSVGTHTLTLENSTEKLRQTTVITIKPGETLSRRLAF